MNISLQSRIVIAKKLIRRHPGLTIREHINNRSDKKEASDQLDFEKQFERNLVSITCSCSNAFIWNFHCKISNSLNISSHLEWFTGYHIRRNRTIISAFLWLRSDYSSLRSISNFCCKRRSQLTERQPKGNQKELRQLKHFSCGLKLYEVVSKTLQLTYMFPSTGSDMESFALFPIISNAE